MVFCIVAGKRGSEKAWGQSIYAGAGCGGNLQGGYLHSEIKCEWNLGGEYIEY